MLYSGGLRFKFKLAFALCNYFVWGLFLANDPISFFSVDSTAARISNNSRTRLGRSIILCHFVTYKDTQIQKYTKKKTHTHRHTYSTENTAKESAKERMTETQQRKKKTDFEVGQIKDDTLYIVVFGSSVYAGIQYTVYASMFILGYSSRDINVFKSVFVYLLILPYACNLIF